MFRRCYIADIFDHTVALLEACTTACLLESTQSFLTSLPLCTSPKIYPGLLSAQNSCELRTQVLPPEIGLSLSQLHYRILLRDSHVPTTGNVNYGMLTYDSSYPMIEKNNTSIGSTNETQ